MPVGIRVFEDCSAGTSSPKGKLSVRCQFVGAGTINDSAGRTRGKRVGYKKLVLTRKSMEINGNQWKTIDFASKYTILNAFFWF
jgi:hypothetical protein